MPTTSEVVRFADVSTSAWLGGGGVTRELLRFPATGDFEWRISVADVTRSGPFSVLPDVDRVLTFCEGPRMLLSIGGAARELERWSPFSFAGEDVVDCHVPDGPTRDLNVMTRRGAVIPSVQVMAADQVAAGVHVIIALDDGVALREDGRDISLRRFDAVRPGNDARLVGDGVVQVVDFRPGARLK